jgi:hypothetical protein
MSAANGPESHEHTHNHAEEEAAALELSTQGQIFLEMRQQNLELLQIAARVGGFMGEHGPMKHSDLKQALRTIWDIYSEFYSWIDPEESDEDEEGGDE